MNVAGPSSCGAVGVVLMTKHTILCKRLPQATCCYPEPMKKPASIAVLIHNILNKNFIHCG